MILLQSLEGSISICPIRKKLNISNLRVVSSHQVKSRVWILYLMATACVKGLVLSPPAAINSTNQIILQRITSFATGTMIRHTHELIGHLGREHISAKVGEKLWIPHIRKAVCSVLSRCTVCKKFHAKPVTQQMAPLPTSRMMAIEPPFSFSGIMARNLGTGMRSRDRKPKSIANNYTSRSRNRCVIHLWRSEEFFHEDSMAKCSKQ